MSGRGHGTAQPGSRHDRDVLRTELFSDAVLAIIITLLGLELRPPQVESGRLLAGLLAEWPVYLAYTTSFVNIAVVWLSHRTAFSRIIRVDLGLSWANFGVLFCTALLPFATAVVSQSLKDGSGADIRTATAFYGLVGTILLGSWWILYARLVRRPELTEQGGPDFFRRERRRPLLGMLLFPAGALVGYFSFWVAFAIFLALPLIYATTATRE
ncbi:TMEM175 family protein [Micromonospora sp. NBC_00389]|uniref:TMEM175 family protein n=1 Tax=Micromonospora sp. NBC_00389 TaxID=2903586 RepID=UPI002E20CA9E